MPPIQDFLGTQIRLASLLAIREEDSCLTRRLPPLDREAAGVQTSSDAVCSVCGLARATAPKGTPIWNVAALLQK